MHLGVARLCLDCHEVHGYERCPACTSEAFAFITRWIKLDDPAPKTRRQPDTPAEAAEKLNTYRQILQPRRSRAGRWLRAGSVLVAAGYLARWGWNVAKQRQVKTDGEPTSGDTGPPGSSD